MTQEMITLLAACLAFVASVIATVVSVYNARLSKFTRQQWWTRKADAYARIIEELSGLVFYYGEHYDATIEHREISQERRKEMEEHWRRSYAEIRRATDVGAFSISSNAEAALQAMWNNRADAKKAGYWFTEMEADYLSARDCLKAIVLAAKADL